MVISFFGHSNFIGSYILEEKIMSVISDEVGAGAVDFLLGNYGGFDRFAYRCCKKYKAQSDNSSLVFVTPYISKGYKHRLNQASQEYDRIIYPGLESKPQRFAIQHRNRYMIEQSDLIICYVSREYGGAYSAIKYAKRLNRRIINLAS